MQAASLALRSTHASEFIAPSSRKKVPPLQFHKFLSKATIVGVALGSMSLLGASLPAAAAAIGPEEAELVASSPAPMTSLALDPTTNIIYGLEFEGTKAFSYNANTNVWTELPEAPASIGNNGGGAFLNGKIYDISTEGGAPMEVYDIASGTWSTIPNPLGAGTADMTAVGGELYLVVESSFVKYNPQTEVTTTLAAPPTPFASASASSGCSSRNFEPWGGLQYYQGKLYGSQGNGCNGFGSYDIAADTWTELPPAPGGMVAGSALDPTTGTFYAYGSYGGDSLYQYDIGAESWSTFALPFQVDDGGLVYVSLPGTRGIYAIQGQIGNQFVRYVTVEPSADLEVSDAAGPASVAVGGQFEYIVTVTNNGPSSSIGSTLTDTLPANARLVSATSTQGLCSGASTVVCQLGTILDEGTATVRLTVTALAGGSGSDLATVSSETADPVAGNNSGSATETIGAADPVVDHHSGSTKIEGPSAAAGAKAPVQCLSARTEILHWKVPKGVHLRTPTISVSGSKTRRLSSRTHTATIDLEGKPTGEVTVEIAAVAGSGRRYASVRVYHLCRAGSGARSVPSLYLTRVR
jgi:uncharacterized repeat protein (TIGR01451 family)